MQPFRTLLPFLFLSSAFAQEPAVVEAQRTLLPEGMAERIRDEGIGRSQAMRLLRDLTGKIGHRLTGSDNFTKACHWAVGEFQAMGIPSVQLEKWAEWRLAWNRGAWIGRITNPVAIELYVATEAWTAGTKGAQTGLIVRAPKELADVDSKAVAGKWVYSSKPPGRSETAAEREIRAACMPLGILGWVHRAGDPDARFPLRVRVFGDHMTAMKTLETVPTVPVIAVRADQADALAELLEAGKEVTGEFDIQNTFRDGGIPLYNVIAEITGSEKPEEVVVVCGHFDSWHQAQGTTDNGTGATSTMEAARILMAVGAKPRRTIRFCLWGGEEEGLLGSAAYVKRHRTEMERVSAVFNHDTGTNWAQGLTAPTNAAHQLEAVFAPVLALLSPPDPTWDGPVFKLTPTERLSGGGGSDHASFLAAGVPGLNWSLRGRSNYFTHTWHTQWDTIAVAIEEYQRHTATVIAMAALGTANLDALLDRMGVVAGGGGRPQSTAVVEAMFDAEMDGLKFKSVKGDGRAAKMGVQKDDVIEKVNGEAVEALRDVSRLSRDFAGEVLTFTVKRGEVLIDCKMRKDELRR